MTTGSCLCGNIKFSTTGEPTHQALCHCLDCRKISGSTYTINIVVPEDGFKLVQGTPKTIMKTGDSGNPTASHFCGDCGTTLYSDGGMFPGYKIIKVGVLDDNEALAKNKPTIELYSQRRVEWVPEIPGAKQM